MVCIPNKLIIGGVASYLIFRYLNRPVIATPDNSIKFHVDEYDRTDPYGIYDKVTISTETQITITDFSNNIYDTFTTDSEGNAYLFYDNRYTKGRTFISTASKYGFFGIDLSHMNTFLIPISEINLSIYKIYSDIDIGIGL